MNKKEPDKIVVLAWLFFDGCALQIRHFNRVHRFRRTRDDRFGQPDSCVFVIRDFDTTPRLSSTQNDQFGPPDNWRELQRFRTSAPSIHETTARQPSALTRRASGVRDTGCTPNLKPSNFLYATSLAA